MLVQTCFNRRFARHFEWLSVCLSGPFNKSVLCTCPLFPLSFLCSSSSIVHCLSIAPRFIPSILSVSFPALSILILITMISETAILICSRLKSWVFAGLHLQFLSLIYLPHLLSSLSRPCSLTSIIFHHPSCSVLVISLAAAVILMYCIDFFSLPIDSHSSVNAYKDSFYFLVLSNVQNWIYVSRASIKSTQRNKGKLMKRVHYCSLIFIIFQALLLPVVSCLHRWGHQLSSGPTSWPGDPWEVTWDNSCCVSSASGAGPATHKYMDA